MNVDYPREGDTFVIKYDLKDDEGTFVAADELYFIVYIDGQFEESFSLSEGEIVTLQDGQYERDYVLPRPGVYEIEAQADGSVSDTHRLDPFRVYDRLSRNGAGNTGTQHT